MPFTLSFLSSAVKSAVVSTGQQIQIKLGKAPFKLSLSWGKVNDLFQGSLANGVGRQERMMALGFFYDKLDGIEGEKTKACWKYMREEFEDEKGKTLTDDDFKKLIDEKLQAVIQKDDGSRIHELDPTQNGRIVYPGAFCYSASGQLGGSSPFTAHRKVAEDEAWKKNLGLGRIPLVAKIVDPVTGSPVKGIRVCFEFIAPFSPNSGQTAYLSNISNQTESTQDPRTYVSSKIADDATPFGFNCPESTGGRKPKDVNGTLIASGAVHGFKYKAATEKRPNLLSMTCVTDEKGEAGVVLRLSRTAGDSFKVKVYVLRDDGTLLSPDESKITGVLTVWRNLRVSKIIEKPVSATPFTGSPPPPAGMVGALGTISTSTMVQEYSKAFHDMVLDKNAKTVMQMTQTEYRDAINHAKKSIANPSNYDLDALVKTDINSPYMFWLADDTDYNANRKASCSILDLTNATTWSQDIPGIISDLKDAFIKCFKTVSGIIVLRNEIGDSYSYWPHLQSPWNPSLPSPKTPPTTSGVATIERGCYVWYPLSVYQSGMPYSVTTNTMHEMGHVLLLRHQYTSPPNPPSNPNPTGGFPANHDPLDYCLMGYLPLTKEDHCGKCLLKLRGWDEAKF